MRILTSTLVLVLTCIVESDIWTPIRRSVISGDYKVRETTFTINTPTSLVVSNAIIDKGFTGTIVKIEAIPPTTVCQGGFLEERGEWTRGNMAVLIGNCHLVVRGYAIESLKTPGLFHLCTDDSSYFDLTVLLSGCVHRGASKLIITHSGRKFSCYGVTAVVHNVEDLIATGSIGRLICKNFGLRITYDDGKEVKVDNVMEPEGLATISLHLEAQGIEIRSSLSGCKTSRCVASPLAVVKPRRVKRSLDSVQVSGVHCGAFLFWAYCPYAVHQDDLILLREKMRNQIKSSMRTLESHTDIRFQEVVSSLGLIAHNITYLQNSIKQNNELLKLTFQQVAKASDRLDFKLSVVAHQESLLRNFLVIALRQRSIANEILINWSWVARLTAGALQCTTRDCSDLLLAISERDPEVTYLRDAHYNLHPLSLPGESIQISYFKPINYTLNEEYLPGRIQFRIEDDCHNGWCSSCLSQPSTITHLPETPIVEKLETELGVTVTPFNVTGCRRTGAPPYVLFRFKNYCLNITITGVHETVCLQSSFAIKAQIPQTYDFSTGIPFPVKWSASQSYVPRVITSLKDGSKGSLIDLVQKTKLDMDSHHVEALSQIEQNYQISHNIAVYSQNEARNALILGGISISIILIQILIKIYKCLRAVRRSQGPGHQGYKFSPKINKYKTLTKSHDVLLYKLHINGNVFYAKFHEHPSVNVHFSSYTDGVVLYVNDCTHIIPRGSLLERTLIANCGCGDVGLIEILY